MKTGICITSIVLIILCFSSVSSKAFAADTPDSIKYTHKAVVFIGLLEAKQFSKAYDQFSSVVKKSFNVKQLETAWNSLKPNYGRFINFNKTEYLHKDSSSTIILSCDFENAYLDIKFMFDREDSITTFIFVGKRMKSSTEYNSAAYVDKNSFLDKEIKFGVKGWELPGTLSIPKAAAERKLPAIVLVHGSGPNDRDESIGPNKVFADIAGGLASRGIIVLRYDKRTNVYGNRMVNEKPQFTLWEETIEDALKAVEFLKTQTDVDTNRIFVLGHSLGGTAIPRIGQNDASIKGLIILAGATESLPDLMVKQYKYILTEKGKGKIDPQDQATIDSMVAQIARMKIELKSKDYNPSHSFMGASLQYWTDLDLYDPVKTAQNINQRMLILQGERDYQVPYKDNYNTWMSGLKERKNTEFKLYPKLNHLFMEGIGKSTPDEYDKPAHVSFSVIEDIAKWINKN
jgi:dienelactone hydrolase